MNTNIEIAKRIAALSAYKDFKTDTDFGAFLGWTKQYTYRILRGQVVGLTVINTILDKFPEVNARWLITGEGSMIDNAYMARYFTTLHQLNDYIPVMTKEELDRVNHTASFTASDLAVWQSRLAERNAAIEDRFRKAQKPAK